MKLQSAFILDLKWIIQYVWMQPMPVITLEELISDFQIDVQSSFGRCAKLCRNCQKLLPTHLQRLCNIMLIKEERLLWAEPGTDLDYVTLHLLLLVPRYWYLQCLQYPSDGVIQASQVMIVGNSTGQWSACQWYYLISGSLHHRVWLMEHLLLSVSLASPEVDWIVSVKATSHAGSTNSWGV